jgi:prophage tail gpP-like protein
MDQRYSIYVPSMASMDANADVTEAMRVALEAGESLAGLDAFTALPNAIMPFPPLFDKDVPRFRPLIVYSEQTQYGQYTCMQRATWERNRRWGRSQAVTLTCDSWRDSAGTLWAPNCFATINLPALKIVAKTWIIAEVTFNRNAENGTAAALTLMPKRAFDVEPSPLELYDWQVAQALQGGGGGRGAAHGMIGGV